MKKLINKLFFWVFMEDLNKMMKVIGDCQIIVNSLSKQEQSFNKILSGIDISVDVHEYNYSPSWAVISLQGQKSDYIKFIDLGDMEIREIGKFLRKFERGSNIKVDASPLATDFLKISSDKNNQYLRQ